MEEELEGLTTKVKEEGVAQNGNAASVAEEVADEDIEDEGYVHFILPIDFCWPLTRTAPVPPLPFPERPRRRLLLVRRH